MVPVSLVRKTLRVAAEDSSWASEMTYLAGPILERLQKVLPGKWVLEIKTVLTEPMPDLPPSPEEIKLRAPTEQMKNRVSKATEGLEDPDLSSAVGNAMLASLRRIDSDGGNNVDNGPRPSTNGEEP